MIRLRLLLAKIAGLFGRRYSEADLDAEIEGHLDLATADHLAHGMTHREARLAARRDFGGVLQTKEAYRAARGIVAIDSLGRDMRYAVRGLRKAPGFTTVAVLSLALGIAATTAIFSVLDALMLRTLPARAPEQLVLFGPPDYAIDYPLVARFRTLTNVFQGVAASILTDQFNVTVAGQPNGEAGPVAVSLVTGNYFSVLGVNAVVGRALTPEDDRVPGGHPVAVISDRCWQRLFQRAPTVLGRTVTVLSTPYTIVGVAPAAFTGDRAGRPVEVWIPRMMESQVLPGCTALRCGAENRILGRLMPGVGLAQAQVAARVVADQFGHDNHWTTDVRLELQPASRGYAPPLDAMVRSVTILLVASGLVLLIACANITTLLLARSAARQREMAIRVAIGAGSGRILQQLLTESSLLSTAGATLGLLLAVWGARALSAILAAGSLASMAESRTVLDAHADSRLLAFNATLCLATTLVFGLAPAVRSSTVPYSALTRRGAGSDSSARLGFRRALAMGQVTVSLVVVVGAGLFLRTLQNLKAQDLGVDRQHVLLVWTAPVQTGRVGSALADLWRTVQQRISAVPGVLSVGASNGGLLSGIDRGGRSEWMRIEGHDPRPGMVNGWTAVAPNFFRTAGVRLIAGRDFTEHDNETGPRVAIVNETMAHFYFENEDAIGKRFAKPGETGYPWEIVGVVADMKDGTPRGVKAIEYSPYRQDLGHLQNMLLVVRTAGNPASVATGVREAFLRSDLSVPVLKINTVEEQLSDVVLQERLMTALAGAFGLFSALLACLGLYGVIAYDVARRRNEIGIRIALGATAGQVSTMVMTESTRLVIGGVAIGIPVTLATMRVIGSRLFGIAPGDPITIAAATALMLAVAGVAGFLPARRASRVDPLAALREG